jgi:hypothetical protein
MNQLFEQQMAQQKMNNEITQKITGKNPQLNTQDVLTSVVKITNSIIEIVTTSLNTIPQNSVSSPTIVASVINQSLNNYNPSPEDQKFFKSISPDDEIDLIFEPIGISLGTFSVKNNIKNANTFINQVSSILQTDANNSSPTTPSPTTPSPTTPSPTQAITKGATSIVHAQKKSHHILIIAIILAVCIALGLVGFFVYRHRHKNTRRRF